jgi:hypothetical protein
MTLRTLVSRTLLFVSAALVGCGTPVDPPASGPDARAEAPGASTTPLPQEQAMNDLAIDYVKLVLALGEHDGDYVDAFYGPAEWKTEVEARAPSLADIDRDAAAVIARLEAHPASGDALEQLRHAYLVRQLQSLRARVAMLGGARLSFDEESQALYDAVAPTQPESHFAGIVQQLDAALPGEGPVAARYQAWRARFAIPADRLDAVFREAVDECRRRTAEHIALPEGESFTIEYVTDKSWSGYNWYQGSYRSLIQVNTDLPIFIDRAVDLACHEGYPGHHVYNVLLEEQLVNARGWPEFQVYALFSPQSLIAEGTANYGIDVAFPGEQRLAYERDVLFPLAGLDPSQADEYYRVQGMVEALGYAGNEAARRYLDGSFDRAQAEAWLTRYALSEPERAAQRVRFIDKYRAYVINYNLGKDLVRRHVEANGGSEDAPARRWDVFADLLRSPRLPSSLD